MHLIKLHKCLLIKHLAEFDEFSGRFGFMKLKYNFKFSVFDFVIEQTSYETDFILAMRFLLSQSIECIFLRLLIRLYTSVT